ncbi:MAG TPA: hypothetical protein VFO30_02035, partial [Chthoniobacterales bacterium]|nr:hypothetical protein [Chthoniobacterales bacterium]
MKIYISGLHSGPNPQPGVGVTRSRRHDYSRARFRPATFLRLFLSPHFCEARRAMLAKIYSAALYGVDAYEVEVEVNGAHG